MALARDSENKGTQNLRAPAGPDLSNLKMVLNHQSSSVNWIKTSDITKLGVSLNMMISGAAEEMRCFGSILICF